jgi:hypothetical protein
MAFFSFNFFGGAVSAGIWGAIKKDQELPVALRKNRVFLFFLFLYVCIFLVFHWF